MRSWAFALFILCSGWGLAASGIKFDLSLVKTWSKRDKSQFPTPLIAVFKHADKTLIFVGDHHSSPAETFQYVESAPSSFWAISGVPEALASALLT